MRAKHHNRVFTVAAFLLTLVVVTTRPAHSAAQERTRVKAADTSSPRDTLRSFINSCNGIHRFIQSEKFLDRSDPVHAEYAAPVLDCIDASELPAFAREERAGEVAVCIKEILDRVDLPPWDEIPDAEAIERAGGFEKLSVWRIPDTRITIARVEEGPQKHEYLFSTGTVDRAVDYFHRIESLPYRTNGPQVSEDLYGWFVTSPGHPLLGRIVARLPKRLQRSRTLGLATWKWPGLLVSLVLTIALMAGAYQAHRAITKRVRNKSIFKYCLTIVFPVAAMLVPLLFSHVTQRYFTVRGNPQYIITFSSYIVALLAAVVVIFAATRRIAEAIIASPRINPQGLNAQLIRISSQLLSVVATVTLFLVGGQFLGIPIATLLASAGIGGIADALGAQDTLKTLFGTVSLMADKPFRVGERIVFDKYDGVVEDIGIRSTKVRLLTGHLVTLPNDQLAGSDIENIARRTHIRRSGTIHIPLDSPCEKVERAVAIIREKLEDHEGMDPEYPPRVFFDDFCSTSFSIRFFYWYGRPNYWDFKTFSEKLNFEIFRAFEEHAIQFSLPLRHSYWKTDDEQGPVDVNIVSNPLRPDNRAAE